MDSVQRKYEETNKVKDLQLKLSQAEVRRCRECHVVRPTSASFCEITIR